MVKIILVILAIVIVFFLIVMIADGNRFVIKKYKLISDKIRNPHRFVVLADLHGKEYGKQNEKLLSAIDETKPDAILIAGDMLAAKKGKKFQHVLRFLNELEKKYPIYYGNGNHEYRLKLYPETYGDMGKDYGDGLTKIGISPLCNESTKIEGEHIVIYGLEMDKKYYKRGRKIRMEKSYLDETIGKPDNKQYNILLAHNPAYFETYAKWGADLVVSGHYHGGIMRLPLVGGVIAPSLALFPKYSGGLYTAGEKEKSVMVLSNGLGSHTLPVRIFNPGQLVVIELECE